MTAPPGAGTATYLSERVLAVRPSGIRRFFDLAAEMDEVISLSIGEPDFTTPEPLIRAAVSALEAGETHYTSNAGMTELRTAVCARLQELYGVRYDPAGEILITVGASEAVDAALRAVLDPGDEVIYHEPCFVAYAPLITFAGGTPVAVATTERTDFRVTAHQIERAITPRTKALFLAYPSNPTGAVLDEAELTDIAAVAERHDLVVVTDEIYDRLTYGGHRHVAFSALPGARDRTVLIGGFSKSYAMTGWRIGYVCAPRDLMTGIAKVHQYGIMCAPTAAQFAALEALRSGEPYLADMLAEYDRRRRLMTDRFNQIGLTCFEPRGAFYCFPRIAGTGLSSDDFAERLLLEERVAVVPGGAFGPSGEGYVRVCYAAAYDDIVEAMDRIERFVGRLRS
ncbi:MAG: aminotransferase class I/II-fold pyridoxal phosphate-dependent enzyme [Chloroflexota bacterium]|nr:aminotransferase class I/II-fold pyridoxal phosphate-dependent enzyme [Chloroflexota bacterium]